jgi:competence protein ComEA
MRARIEIFVSGLLFGLLASGLVLLLIAEPRGHPVRLGPIPTPAPIEIHVSGAVAAPGVYRLPAVSIVEDALEAAGGARPDAMLQHLNLAAPLENGQQVVVPVFPTPAPSPLPGTPQPPSAGSGILSLNAATAAELETLPGIGPVLAQNIVDYREAHGPFARLEDLLRVPGIGPAKLAQLEAYLTLP